MSRSQHFLAWACAGLLLSVVSTPGVAADFCATSASQLSNALYLAAFNGEDDVILVARGTYDGSGANDFAYLPAEISGGDVGTSLSLVGGYTSFLGNPCASIPVQDPSLTVLDGGDLKRALFLHVNTDSDVSVRLFTFQHGITGGDTNLVGGGLAYQGGAGSSLTIERNAFLANQARYGVGLSIITADAVVRVINNLFFGNQGVGCSAAKIQSFNSNPGTVGSIHIANNTATGNTIQVDDGVDGGGGFCIVTSVDPGPSHIALYNNNFWGNDASDLYVDAGDQFDLHHNNIGERTGDAPTASSGNINVVVEYESGLYNFTPKRNSPLVDAGMHPPPPPTLSFWYLTDYDLRFQARVVGGTVDIGAYENERIFVDGFE